MFGTARGELRRRLDVPLRPPELNSGLRLSIVPTRQRVAVLRADSTDPHWFAIIGRVTYLMAGQLSELDRLQLQSRVWEPAGQRLLDVIGDGTGKRALDAGCGCYGWLRILSAWVGPTGSCVGTDVSDDLLAAARDLVRAEGLSNVDLCHDDLFATALPEGSFDLVHARFQLAPLGRFTEQIDAYLRLLAPGGVLVLEDPDTSSWTFTPPAPNAERVIQLIRQAFIAAAADFDAGRIEYELLTVAGLQPQIRAEVVALPPQHPYLQLPLQFATSLRPRLLNLLAEAELDALLASAREELAQPERRGLTFTVVQTWANRPQ
jgi:SAM-dependent methyltransferase